MKNYSYGKFENGVFIYAPSIIKKQRYEIINPTEKDYLESGFFKIVETEQPQKDGFYYTRSISDVNGVPTVVWKEHIINIGEDL